MTLYYVYVLRVRETGEAKYVGCTKDPLARFSRHIHTVTYLPVSKWIQPLLPTIPVMQLINVYPDKITAMQREEFVTQGLRAAGAVLLNTKYLPDQQVYEDSIVFKDLSVADTATLDAAVRVERESIRRQMFSLR